MPRPFRRASFIAVALTCAATLSLSLRAQTMGTPERYTANAINMDRGAAGTIELVVNRWSTDKDRDRLMSVLMSKGPEKLLDDPLVERLEADREDDGFDGRGDRSVRESPPVERECRAS